MIPIDFNDLTQISAHAGELLLSVEASDIGLRGWPETLVVEREENGGVTLLHFRRAGVMRDKEREVIWVSYVSGSYCLDVFND